MTNYYQVPLPLVLLLLSLFLFRAAQVGAWNDGAQALVASNSYVSTLRPVVPCPHSRTSDNGQTSEPQRGGHRTGAHHSKPVFLSKPLMWRTEFLSQTVAYGCEQSSYLLRLRIPSVSQHGLLALAPSVQMTRSSGESEYQGKPHTGSGGT